MEASDLCLTRAKHGHASASPTFWLARNLCYKQIISLLSLFCHPNEHLMTFHRAFSVCVSVLCDFIIKYLPGSQLYPADTLSRFPLPVQPDLIWYVWNHRALRQHCHWCTSAQWRHDRPSSFSYCYWRRATAGPSTFCNTSWPNDLSHLAPDLQQYWHSRDHLTVQYELVLYDARIVIPKAIHQTTLEALHSSHLGITKCRAKARSAIWWPKIGIDIQQYISTC